MSAPATAPPAPRAGRGIERSDARRVPRNLHPIGWWIWAIGLAVAASRTTNPLLLMLVLAVLGFVVASRRTDAPWARAFKYYLFLALIVISLRVVFRVVFGSGVTSGDHIIVTLPAIPTPDWYAGIQFGGPVSLEALLSAASDGLRLGTLLCCIGAANALANPKRALRVLPGALYELGMAVVVAISVAPQLIDSMQRVLRARRLRAGRTKGFRALRAVAIPVIEDAFERSLRLAAAMDSRGYGRTGPSTRRARRLTGALMLGGLVGICAGAYGLLDATTPRYLGIPAIVAGGVLSTAGLLLGGRRVTRTHYRPDPWAAPEWAVVACGVGSAVLFYLSSSGNPAAINPSFSPLQFPPLPPVPVLAILLGAMAAFASPPPLRYSTTGRRG